MNDNPFSSIETHNDAHDAVNSNDWSWWRLVPAGILTFIGLQVLLAVAMSLVEFAFSPVKRGPQAPPMYITIFVIGRLVFFGLGLIYAAIAIMRGRDGAAALAIVTAVTTLILSFTLL